MVGDGDLQAVAEVDSVVGVDGVGVDAGGVVEGVLTGLGVDSGDGALEGVGDGLAEEGSGDAGVVVDGALGSGEGVALAEGLGDPGDSDGGVVDVLLGEGDGSVVTHTYGSQLPCPGNPSNCTDTQSAGSVNVVLGVQPGNELA